MMTVFCEGRDYGYELAGVAMLFFRGEKVIPAKEGEEPLDNFILAETNLRPGRASLSVTVEREERTWEASEIVPVSEENPDHDCELHLARMLYQILSEITGITPKWGVLTGIRPVKLVQRRLDQGLSREEAARELREDYLVSQEKLDLAFATQQKEHAILSRNTPDSFSLYISIPFCPSRCLYCSFVSHSIEKAYKLIGSVHRLSVPGDRPYRRGSPSGGTAAAIPSTSAAARLPPSQLNSSKSSPTVWQSILTSRRCGNIPSKQAVPIPSPGRNSR